MIRSCGFARLAATLVAAAFSLGSTTDVLANGAAWYPSPPRQEFKFVRPPAENKGPTEVFNLFEIRRDPQATRPKLLLPKSWLVNNSPPAWGKMSTAGPARTSTIIAGSAISLAITLAGLTWFGKAGRSTVTKYGACAVALLAATSGGYAFANLAPYPSRPVTGTAQLTSPRVLGSINFSTGYYDGPVIISSHLPYPAYRNYTPSPPPIEVKIATSPNVAGVPPLPIPNQHVLKEFENLLFSSPVEVEIVEEGFAATLVLDAEVSVPAMQMPGPSLHNSGPSFRLRVQDSYLPPQLKPISDRFETLELK